MISNCILYLVPKGNYFVMFKRLVMIWMTLGMILIVPVVGANETGNLIIQGHNYLREWDLKEAFEKANKFLKNSPDSAPALYLMGLVHFYRTEYKEAIDYLQRASDLNPRDRRIQEFLDFASKTYKITKLFSEYQSEHFILRLSKEKDEVLVGYALSALEKAYQEVGGDLGFFPKGKLVVEVYPTSEDFNIASSLSKRDMEVSGAIGICKFARIMILSPRNLVRGYRWMDTLTHEYAHFLINRISKARCPLWLHEGIAKYEETRWRRREVEVLTPSYQTLLARALKEDGLISFERMSPSLVKLDTREEVQLSFAEVATAVEFIVRNYGQKRLFLILQELGRKRDLSQVFSSQLGVSFAQFQEDWRRYLKDKGLEILPGIGAERLRLKGSGEEYQEEELLQEIEAIKTRNHVRLGDMFRRRGMFKAAIIEYRKASELSPNNAIILNKLGKAYLLIRDPAKAIQSYRAVINAHPNYVTTYTNLGDLYLSLGNPEEAIENYQESIQINPFNPWVHKNLGYLYYHQGQILEAKKKWEITLLLTPHDPQVHLWLTNIKEEQQEKGESEQVGK